MGAIGLRDIGRVLLIGGLAAALVVGLVWAFNPSDDEGVSVASDPTPTAAPTPTASEPEEPAAPTTEPTPEATETGPSPEELISAAPEASATTVQVLDAGGGGQRAQAAADALRELGYQVVNVTAARATVSSTTVWFNPEAEDAALALRARDGRVAQVAPNEALSAGVNLHLLVGPDWTG